MIQIQLQAQHFYFIANDLKNVAAYVYGSLLNRIKAATDPALTDEEMVTVETSVDDLVAIFTMLSQKKEGEANMINTAMVGVLMPQIGAGIQAQNPEWIEAAQRITAVREANWAITDAAIVDGKAFLQSL